MRTLRYGHTGPDVKAWEQFLVGVNPKSRLIVDEIFGLDTLEETKKFQKTVGLHPKEVDGIVGPTTLGHAMIMGFNPLFDAEVEKTGPNWPPRPEGEPMPLKARLAAFGQFAFTPAPTAASPEAIVITDDWADKNIVTFKVEKIKSIAPSISLHRLVVPQFERLIKAWDKAGNLDKLLSWGGSWVPRFIRGSRSNLSNHAWGTAFDINVQWNMLGACPALVGARGCVRELVEAAYDNGFYWGGWYPDRPDGMHFEIRRIIP